jgi:two-component system sensor histidine kinase DctS
MEFVSEAGSEELERLRRLLMTRSRAMLLGMMVGTLIHDLNNPLTAINGNVELLQLSPAAQDAKVKKRLDTIQSGSKRMSDKMRAVQLFTKTGRADGMIDLNEIAHETARAAEYISKPSKLPIATEFTSEPMVVAGNPNQVAQALLMIVDNALDAVMATTGAQITIQTKKPAAHELAVSVINNGPEITAELGNKIFEPFFTTKSDAAGLGLFLARQMVEENRGRIDWQSTAEQTAFTITLISSHP